jgi:hypothetical protein
MPVVEKVKKPAVVEDAVQVVEDVSIEKPRARKPPTEAMKEAGRKNLEKGRLALQEKRKASGKAEKVPTEPKVAVLPLAPTPPPEIPRQRSKKVIYQEESESDDEVVIVRKKKKAPKKVIYEEESEDEPIVVRKKKTTTPEVERPPSPPRYVQPTAVLRWI